MASTAATPTTALPPRPVRTSRPALPVATIVTWALCALTLGPFLVYPVARVLWGALSVEGKFDPSLLLLPAQDEGIRESVRNSFFIGLGGTILATIIALPLAYAGARLRFAGTTF